MVKHPVAMQETRGRSLGWEDPLEKEMATTPVLLPGNPMDRGAWQAIGSRATVSDTTES